MKMNRRNVLLGLGTIVAGGGAALGTGAFSTASAERDITITATADSDALIGLEHAESSTWVTEENDVLTINADELNVDGTFEVEPAFTVVNNHDESVEITLDDDAQASDPSIEYSNTDFTLDASDPADSEEIDLTIDTHGVDADDEFDITLTVTASTDPN